MLLIVLQKVEWFNWNSLDRFIYQPQNQNLMFAYYDNKFDAIIILTAVIIKCSVSIILISN